MYVNERGVEGGELLGSLVGSSRRVVEEVLWGNVVRGLVFVDTWGEGWGILFGGQEGEEWDGRLEWVTHCYFMTLPSSNLDDETKEMSGEERQVCEL